MTSGKSTRKHFLSTTETDKAIAFLRSRWRTATLSELVRRAVIDAARREAEAERQASSRP